MKGVVIHPNGMMSEATEEKFCDQGFYVEMLPLGQKREFVMMFDEDGRRKNLPYNAIASSLVGHVCALVGDVLVLMGDEDKDCTIDGLKAHFAAFFGDDDDSFESE